MRAWRRAAHSAAATSVTGTAVRIQLTISMLMLRNAGIRSLIVAGVTTEVCVHTTVREANDRGFECFVPSDCVASYFPEFHEVGLRMIAAQGGIFGWVTASQNLLAHLLPTAAVVN